MNQTDDELCAQWNLGFVQAPTDAISLLRHQFRSKVGGRPVSEVDVLWHSAPHFSCLIESRRCALPGLVGPRAPARPRAADLQ